MGYSAKAKLVYGIKVSESDLEITSSKRGCSHEEENSRFCPQCGRPMFIETVRTAEFSSASKIEAHYSDGESSERVLGIKIGEETDGIRAVPEFDPVDLSRRVIEACQQNGLRLPKAPMSLHLILRHGY